MHTFFSVLKDFIHFFNLHTTIGRIRLAVLVSIAVGAVYFLAGGTQAVVESVKQERAVAVSSVAFFSDSVSTQLVGTVSSIDQAIIQAESAGRVTSVEVALGQSIAAGQVIARLENASEYASVLQAEGAYEGALASAQASDISVTEAGNAQVTAEKNVLSAYRTAYTVVSNALYNTLDEFYGNPEFSTPGVRIDAGSQTAYLNAERTAFRSILPAWQKSSVTLAPSGVKENQLQEAISYTARLLAMTDIFITAIERADQGTTLNNQPISTYAVRLSGVRTTLNVTLASLESSVTELQAAQAALNKSQLGGTLSEVSSANAQVKQALGSLRAAQANYNKTILRSPIAGVVNSLAIQTGDFVSGFQTVAEVANNDALEITTFVGQSDRALLETQQEVRIEGGIIGVVSAIAPAVNTATGKIEVQIQSTSPDLLNGDTVIITLDSQVDATGDTTIQVPLTAVKFTASAGVVYSVTDNVLVAHDVTIGPVRDVYIEILSGITPDMEIVVDARGLNEGERVTVVTN